MQNLAMVLANSPVSVFILTVVEKLWFVLSVCLDMMINICQQFCLLHQPRNRRKSFQTKLLWLSSSTYECLLFLRNIHISLSTSHPPSVVKICFQNKCHLPLTYSSITCKHPHSFCTPPMLGDSNRHIGR